MSEAESCARNAEEPLDVAAETSDSKEEAREGKVKSPIVRAALHVKWAFFLQKANEHARAVEHFKSSIELCRTARGYFGLGTSLAALRQRAEAIAAFESALQIAPRMTGAHINLAGVFLATQRYAEAADHCHAALELDPHSPEAVMNLANAMRSMGCKTEADNMVWQHVSASEQVEDPFPLEPVLCNRWSPSGTPPLVVVCVKWGTRYDAAYVNRLFHGVKRHIGKPDVPFVCYTEDPVGLDPGIEVRSLPSSLKLWWGKAYLFSEEAGLDGHRVLFLDLDQVIVGSLASLADYSGPFALLSTDGIACELAAGGYNSSVMAWESSTFFRCIYSRLTEAVLKYVVRFDHWLEMNIVGADLWQRIAPGAVLDYTTVFRGGVCLGGTVVEEEIASTAFRDATDNFSQDVEAAPEGEELLSTAALVTFPRYPKPHEVLAQHTWLREHWLAAALQGSTNADCGQVSTPEEVAKEAVPSGLLP